MGFWIHTGSWKFTLLSRNTIPTAVFNKCLGGNNWRSPPTSLWAITSTIRGLLFVVPTSTITAITGRHTVGNAADNVGNACWGSCPFFSRCHAVFRQPLPRLMEGRNGPAVWPPRSPDLTTADFYLWGHLKSVVYAQWCSTRDELWNAIEAAGTTIRNMPDVFQRTRNSWRNRAQLRADCNGGPFQHLL
jgi:hypothetical protein